MTDPLHGEYLEHYICRRQCQHELSAEYIKKKPNTCILVLENPKEVNPIIVIFSMTFINVSIALQYIVNNGV